MSASLWGCELKCHERFREALCFHVSLLVRLWVEIPWIEEGGLCRLSASLWGCELKCPSCPCSWSFRCRQPPCEAVSWNAFNSSVRWCHVGQPPCEAVSWNINIRSDRSIGNPSASLWGCELKCHCRNSGTRGCEVSLLVRLWVEMPVVADLNIRHSSASLWGCELK